MIEEIVDLTEKEFMELSETEKWKLMESIKKLIRDLKIKADKNCEDCEKNLLTVDDVNIDLFFQDWRSCAEYCEECGEEEKRNMCHIQFELMNHIANTLLELQRKQNVLTQVVLKRDETGSKLLKEFMKKKEDHEKKEKDSYDIYQ
ncbi:MAG: hypothetical protein ACFFDX_14290 [Candidatus Odinarchaeota archaeon]